VTKDSEMSTTPKIETLNIEEQLARIAKMRVETDKRIQETRLVSPKNIFQGALAIAGLIGAGAALGKLFFTN
jgi:hypothetical protein